MRYLTLNEKINLVWVESDGQVVKSDLYDVLTNFLWIVKIVGKRLGVSDEHKHLIVAAGILDSHPVL